VLISGLNHTAYALAVYASQRGSPQHHARLASGCRSTLPGRTGYLLGSNERFQACGLWTHFAVLLSQAFRGAPAFRAVAVWQTDQAVAAFEAATGAPASEANCWPDSQHHRSGVAEHGQEEAPNANQPERAASVDFEQTCADPGGPSLRRGLHLASSSRTGPARTASRAPERQVPHENRRVQTPVVRNSAVGLARIWTPRLGLTKSYSPPSLTFYAPKE
jgi:hypothetical protein